MAIPDTSSGTLYVDGKWRHSASGLTFPVTNPATSEVLAQVSAAETQDVREAVAAAESAFPAWAAKTAYERAGYLYEAHRLMVERADDLAKLMTTEQGKPLRTARIEVQYAADFLIWFAEEAKRVYGQTIPSARADQRFMVLRQPVGVVGAVTPWNYP
ncbi:MAG TPA: aldehyde dehydrogenase family protein, partial [Trebonia sp.]|nr:aldehyde dehydrogenase family protein [Trebonia sp.]